MWGLICTHELDGYNCPIDVLLYNCPIYVRCLTFCFILCDTPNRRLLATDVTVKLGWSKLAHNAFQTILTIITVMPPPPGNLVLLAASGVQSSTSFACTRFSMFFEFIGPPNKG